MLRVQQFAVCIAIAILLPLLTYSAANLISPPGNWRDFYQQTDIFERRLNKTKDKAQRAAVNLERKRARTNFDKRNEKNQNTLFVLAHCVGVVAFLISVLVTIQSLSTGFLCGGLSTVGEAYSNWDKIPEATRFFSLLCLLLVLCFLAWWKYRASRSAHLC